MGQAESYEHGKVYDLIVVGSGTAAAAYINSIHQNTAADLLPLNTLIIGKEDPWAGARGYEKNQYTQYLNQAGQLLDRGHGSEAVTTQEPTDRKAWANENSTVINSYDSDFLNAEVRLIEKILLQTNEQAFKVSTTNGDNTYVAHQIVLATGAGIEPDPQKQSEYQNNTYHEIPTFAAGFRDGLSVMNLDEFQSSDSAARQGGGKSLAVFGPNAGTDAIMEASLRNYSIKDTHWFIKQGSPPGTDLTFDISDKSPAWTVQTAARDKNVGGLVVRYDGDNTITLSRESGKLKIAYLNNGAAGSILVDFVVYALGQRGGGIKHRSADPGQKLESIISDEIKNALEPIYDTDRRFASGPAQHVLGLQLKGTARNYGLRVVGSGANQAARDVRSHNFLDVYIGELLTTIRGQSTLIAGVIDSRSATFSWLMTEKFKDIQKPLDENTLRSAGDAFMVAIRQALGLKISGKSKKVNDTRSVCESAAKDLVYHQKLRQLARQQHLDKALAGEDVRVSGMLSAGFKETKPATTADNRLVGGLMSNINAIHGNIPVARIKNKEGGVNFSEDRQVIALYIARNYPNITPAAANEFIEKLEKERVTKLRGFSSEEIEEKKRTLAYFEDFPKITPKKQIGRYLINT